jgi:hypothetical protein
MTTYLVWALVLMVQNAAFTFVSRARNSGSYPLHALAAVCSNGIYISNLFMSFDILLDAIHRGTVGHKLFVIVWYTAFTVAGAISWHWLSINYIEKGKRKVGA